MENSTNLLVDTNDTDVPLLMKESTYERHKAFFWGGVALYLCLSIIAIAGNGLVLYTSFTNFNMGSLRHLDTVIKSLAMADLLFGLIGIPCKIVNDYYIGKYHDYHGPGLSENGNIFK